MLQAKRLKLYLSLSQDDLNEFDETVTVTLSNETNATIASAVGTLTITDDEERPTLSIASVTSSDEQATDLVATVTLSANPHKQLLWIMRLQTAAQRQRQTTAVSDTPLLIQGLNKNNSNSNFA